MSALSTELKRQYKERTKGTRAGEGTRFKVLKETLARRKGVKTPGALAAWIGRRKYGAKQMAQWSAAGRK